jgi:regulator of replication initiation timing
MKFKFNPKSIFTPLFLIVGAMFCVSMATVHVRTQTVLVGYEIGILKEREASLIEERSRLQMELSKLTNRNALRLMAEKETPVIEKTQELAARM